MPFFGEFEMGSADQTLELPLPEGHLIQDGFTFRESWMNQEPEFASDTATGDLRTDFDPQIHEYTIFMPDSVTDMQLVALGQSGWYLYYTMQRAIRVAQRCLWDWSVGGISICTNE